MSSNHALLLITLAALGGCTPFLSDSQRTATNESPVSDPDPLVYLREALLAPSVLPSDLSELSIACDVTEQAPSAQYLGHHQVDYAQPGWEQRVAADWRYFDAPAHAGAITVIDYRQVEGQLAYRYLANDNTQGQLYEPWSTSKIQAFSAAVATLRRNGIGADASVGGVTLRDMVTSINSYAPSGNADGNSNAIATFLLNIAGRDYATSLFSSAWLNLANSAVRFRGAYGPSAFAPGSYEFVSSDRLTRFTPDVYDSAKDDPGYLDYRCAHCGTDGNKAMTSLAQAEWLKRLASHEREPATRHPHLHTEDVETLFFGGATTQDGKTGGMLMGISRFLPNALAYALAPGADATAQDILERRTKGRWRVFQKVGWGPSETRGTSELVMLAHVCLPNVGGSGREFTLLARAAVPGDDVDESGVGRAGLKLRKLLHGSLAKLLADSAN